MSSRVGGVVALGAAVLVAIALITSAWWAGHPRLDGHEIEYKTATIGLRGGTLCNTGGDGKCHDIPLGGGFMAAGIIETIVGAIAMLALIAIGIAGLRGAARSKEIVRVALLVVGASAIAAIAFTLARPASADVPIGYGTIVFWLGTLGGVIGGVLTARTPQPRAARPAPAFVPAPAAANPGAVDVLALFQDELRTGGEPALPPPPAFGHAPAFVPPAFAPPAYAPPTYGMPAGYPPPAYNAPNEFSPGTDASAPEHAPALGYQAQLAQMAPLPPSRPSAPAFAPPPPPAIAPTPPATIPPPIAGVATVIPLPPIVAPPLPPPGGRFKPPTWSPPVRPPGARAAPTIASAIPPPPSALLAKPITIPPPMVPVPSDGASDSDLNETARRDRAQTETSEFTEASATPFAEDTSPNMMPSDAAEPARPRAKSVNEEAETVARERISASELDPVLSSTPRHDRMPRDSVPTLTGETALPPATKPPLAVAVGIAPQKPAESPDDVATPAAPATAAPSPVTLAAASPPPPTIATPAPAAAPDPARAASPIALSTAPDTLAPPTPEQVATSGPSPACPQCDAPMAWVEAHLRFFCKPCRMYF